MRFSTNAHDVTANGLNRLPAHGIYGAEAELRDEVPVLIVGGGPSGLLQAYLLAQLGVKSLVIERYPNRLAAPKAHALSPRSLEICRQFGLDVNRIRSLGSQRKDAYWVNFVTSLDGEHLGKLPYERMDTSVLDATPEMIHNIPQPEFEQFITQALNQSELVEIRKNISYVSCYQKQHYVVATLEDRAQNSHYSVRARYVIGCDGANSTVRQSLGVASEGEKSYETMMTIHFHADLRPIVGSNVGILHWIMDAEVSGFIIAYDLGGNQVLISSFDPDKHPVNSWTGDLCLRLLRVALGKNADIEVVSWRPWILSRSVANKYRVGNVFLAGDAAHSFPPTGGLGLNSGLADVHNLAYRIAANIQGWGGDALLDLYEFDRRHVAQINSQQSVKNGKKIFGLLKALGTTEKDVATARNNLHHALRDVAQRKEIDLEIKEQQEHFDNLELHIGYVYGSRTYPSNASHYSPKYIVGARLPHAWIEHVNADLVGTIMPSNLTYVSELSESDIMARRYSTLDLCARHGFTLIQTAGCASIARGDAVLRLIAADKRISSGTPLSTAGKPKPLLQVATLGKDFHMMQGVHGQTFCANLGLLDCGEGGVLVRPDQHILKRVEKDTTAEEIVNCIGEHLFGNF